MPTDLLAESTVEPRDLLADAAPPQIKSATPPITPQADTGFLSGAVHALAHPIQNIEDAAISAKQAVVRDNTNALNRASAGTPDTPQVKMVQPTPVAAPQPIQQPVAPQAQTPPGHVDEITRLELERLKGIDQAAAATGPTQPNPFGDLTAPQSKPEGFLNAAARSALSSPASLPGIGEGRNVQALKDYAEKQFPAPYNPADTSRAGSFVGGFPVGSVTWANPATGVAQVLGEGAKGGLDRYKAEQRATGQPTSVGGMIAAELRGGVPGAVAAAGTAGILHGAGGPVGNAVANNVGGGLAGRATNTVAQAGVGAIANAITQSPAKVAQNLLEGRPWNEGLDPIGDLEQGAMMGAPAGILHAPQGDRLTESQSRQAAADIVNRNARAIPERTTSQKVPTAAPFPQAPEVPNESIADIQKRNQPTPVAAQEQTNAVPTNGTQPEPNVQANAQANGQSNEQAPNVQGQETPREEVQPPTSTERIPRPNEQEIGQTNDAGDVAKPAPRDLLAEPAKAAPTASETPAEPSKQPWEMNRNDWQGAPGVWDDVERSLTVPGRQRSVQYRYVEPGPGGPFTGKAMVGEHVNKGDVIDRDYGKARVVNAGKVVEGKPTKPTSEETFNAIRAQHAAAVKKAVAEGKTVPAEVLADYPGLQKLSPSPAEPVSPKGETPAKIESTNAPEFKGNLIDHIAADVKPDGSLPHDMDHYRSMMQDAEYGDLKKIANWAREKSPELSRSIGAEALDELRDRGAKVDSPEWQQKNLVPEAKASTQETPASPAQRTASAPEGTAPTPPNASGGEKAEPVAARQPKTGDLFVRKRPQGGGFMVVEKTAKSQRLPKEFKASGETNKFVSDEEAQSWIDRTRGKPEEAAVDRTSAEPEKFGPGAAATNDPNFDVEKFEVTGIKNRVQEAERANRNLPGANQPTPERHADVWDGVRDELKAKPEIAIDLVNSLRDNPRAPTTRETFILDHRQIELQNEERSVGEKIAKAYEAGDEDAARTLQLRHSALLDKLYELYEVGKSVGTESGRSLASRRAMFADDYSMHSLEIKKRASVGGRPLTDAEHEQIKQLHDRITELEKQVETHENEKADATRKKALNDTFATTKGEVTRETQADVKAGRKRDIAGEKESILNGLKDRVKDGADPSSVGTYIQKLFKSFIAEGQARDTAVDSVHKAIKDIVPGITRDGTMDAISGYGDYRKLSKEALDVKVRQAKQELQALGKLRDLASKLPPKRSGMERQEPSAEGRQLLKKVNDEMRRLGIKAGDPATQLKTALDAIKSRMKNAIDDIQLQLDTGKKFVRTKTGVPLDAEAKALKLKLSDMRDAYTKAFGDPKATDEYRIAAASQALDKSIANVQEQIKTGKLYPDPAAPKMNTPELNAKRAQLEALKNDLDGLRQLHPPDDASVKADAKKQMALQANIDSLEARIKAGDIATKNGKPTADSAAVSRLKAQRDILNERLDAMREAAKPPKPSPEEVALAQAKARTLDTILNTANKIAAGDYAPKSRNSVTPDAELTRLRAESERIRGKFQQGLMAERLKSRPAYEKAGDALAKWTRGGALSFPTVLAKLTSAAFLRTVSTPVENLAGAPFAKLYSRAAERSPIDAGFSVKAEAKALTDGFTTGMKGSWDELRTGQSDRQARFDNPHAEGKRGLLEFLGSLHGAIKEPVAQAHFARAYQMQVEHGIRNGIYVHDPIVQARYAIEANKAARRSIFMQDNRAQAAFNATLRTLEAKDPKTGNTSKSGKFASTLVRTALPITKVPTNIVAETMQYTFGLVSGHARLAAAYRAGIDTLPPEHADLIFRELKKGLVGNAALALGALAYKDFGGYYGVTSKRDESDVPEGGARVFGVPIPKALLHNPLMEQVQIGATLARTLVSRFRPKDRETQGFLSALFHVTTGIGEEVPYVREAIDLGKIADPNSRGQEGYRKIASIAVPGAIQTAAKYLDKTKAGEPIERKPEGLIQNLEANIPGLRKSVPVKQPPKR